MSLSFDNKVTEKKFFFEEHAKVVDALSLARRSASLKRHIFCVCQLLLILHSWCHMSLRVQRCMIFSITMVPQYFLLVMKLPGKFHIGTKVATTGATVYRRALICRAW